MSSEELSLITKEGLERSINSLEVLLIIFGVLVAVGVAGESIFGFRLWRKNSQLRAVEQLETAQLNKAAGEANELAGRANERAGKLEKEAADARLATQQLSKANIEAGEKLEAERRERLTLEEFLSPRSEGDQYTLAKKIEAFAGIEVRINALADMESRRLQETLAFALNLGKWNVKKYAPVPLDVPSSVFPDGVTVWYFEERPKMVDGRPVFPPEGNDLSHRAAKALADELNDRKLDTTIRSTFKGTPFDPDLPPGVVEIRIGMKPSRGMSELHREGVRRTREIEQRFKDAEERNRKHFEDMCIPLPPRKKQ